VTFVAQKDSKVTQGTGHPSLRSWPHHSNSYSAKIYTLIGWYTIAKPRESLGWSKASTASLT
jgi:hypothetical protein